MLVEQPYVFDNDDPHAEEQHRCLARLLDPFTTHRLDQLGVDTKWRCLEVGGGGGSVAGWLSGRVGPDGDVLVTDIRPGRLTAGGNIRVRMHDIANDPLEEGAYDLIHARAVLFHLPTRDEIVAKLARALKPGGWLQIDDFDLTHWPGLQFRDDHHQAVYERFRVALNGMFTRAGSQLSWGNRLSHVMRAAGLVDIDHAVEVNLWRAHTPGADLMYNHTLQQRDELMAGGMTEADLVDTRTVLRDPEYRGLSFALHSAQGRRA